MKTLLFLLLFAACGTEGYDNLAPDASPGGLGEGGSAGSTPPRRGRMNVGASTTVADIEQIEKANLDIIIQRQLAYWPSGKIIDLKDGWFLFQSNATPSGYYCEGYCYFFRLDGDFYETLTARASRVETLDKLPRHDGLHSECLSYDMGLFGGAKMFPGTMELTNALMVGPPNTGDGRCGPEDPITELRAGLCSREGLCFDKSGVQIL